MVGLTRVERLILILAYVEKLNAKEIGATLDLSESSIKKMHSKLLDVIYPHLKKEASLLYPFSPDIQKPVISRIQEANHELINHLAKHPNLLYQLNPKVFERLIAKILEYSGCTVELTAPVRDGGRDIIAFKVDDLGIKTKYIIECKRYGPENPVRIHLVRALYGIKGLNEAQHAILATTSYFTRDAIEFTKLPSIYGLHLKDYDVICEWLQKYSGAKLINV